MDGFTNEGWKNIYTLFEPSFYADDTRIYYASDSYASSDIEELMPRNEKHTFIYLSMQRGEYPGSTAERIHHYRYKRTLDIVKKQFPYYIEHNNIFLVLDSSPKVLGREEYREYEKQISYELDQRGYLADNSRQKSLFSIEELSSIDKAYDTYASTVDDANTDKRINQDILDSISADSIRLIEDKKSAIEDASSPLVTIEMLQDIQQQLMRRLSRIKEKEIGSRSKKPSYLLKTTLQEYYSIVEDLRHFTILQFPYTSPIDIELFLKVGSLLSVITNAKRTIFKPYWLEIIKLDINTSLLKTKLEKLQSITLEEKKEQTYRLELNNIETILLPDESITIEFPDQIETPWFYSAKEEEILASEIKQYHSDVGYTLETVVSNLKRLKKEIHDYSPIKIEKVFTKKELKESIENKEFLQSVNYRDSLKKIYDTHESFDINEFTTSALHEIRKLPSVFKLLISFVLISMVTIFPYIQSQEWGSMAEWYKHPFVLVVLVSFVMITMWNLYRLKSKLRTLIGKYHKMTYNILRRIEEWQRSAIGKYSELFLQKLRNENSQIIAEKYFTVKKEENQSIYHKNRINFIKGQTNTIKNFFDLKIDSYETLYSISDPSKSAGEVITYALFDEKLPIQEVIVDIGLIDKNIKAYGFIRKVEIKKVIGGEK